MVLVEKGFEGRQAFGGRQVVGPPSENGIPLLIMQRERGSGTCITSLFFGRVVPLLLRQASDATLVSPAGGLKTGRQKFICRRGGGGGFHDPASGLPA